MNMRDVLERIEERRIALSKSEARLCKDAGLSDSAIRNWRRKLSNGEEDFGMNASTVEALARELQVSENWLKYGKVDPQTGNGFAEPRPASLADKILQHLPPADANASAKPTEDDIRIGTDGARVQIIANVDRKGLERLLKKIEAIEALLDD